MSAHYEETKGGGTFHQGTSMKIRKLKINREKQLMRKMAGKKDALSSSDLKVLFTLYPGL